MNLRKNIQTFLTLALASLPFFSYAQFTDVSQLAGIANTGQNRGVAVMDFDRDGREDIYVTRLDGPNLLYKNQGDGTFNEIAALAGLDYAGPSGTAAWGDLDNDGLPDLVLGNRDEASRIYRNLGDGTFTDITLQAAVDNQAKVMSVNLADINGDGWLDIYFANLGAQNAMFRNNGDGTFTDYTYPSNTLDDGLAMGAIFFDYDLDGDQDLYLTHDGNQPNILYQNNGQGFFLDVSRESGLNLSAQGMGVDVADIDQDGYPDVYITNLYENALFRNLGNGTFEDISATTGVTDRGMGWGTAFLDVDNDTWPDIYVANETKFAVDFKEYNNILYQNMGNLKFRPEAEDEVLQSPYGGYGLATADFDGNGSLDLFIANSGADGNQLLLNQARQDVHWVKLKLEGRISNRSAIGARVEIQLGEQILVDEVIGGSGFAGQNSLNLHFGLGSAEQIDLLRIHWPSGLVEIFEDLEVDQTYSFIENAGLTSAPNKKPIHDFRLNVSPNPTFGPVNVQLYLPVSVTKIKLSLYNTYGQLLEKVIKGPLNSGNYQLNFGENLYLSSGLIFLEVEIEGHHQLKKIMYMGH